MRRRLSPPPRRPLCAVLSPLYLPPYLPPSPLSLSTDRPQGAAEIIARGKNKEEATRDYEEKFANPIMAAERGFVDGILRPRDTRRVICEDLELFQDKQLTNPTKKHANMPL